MLLSIISSNLWLALALWVGIYVADYALTLRGAHLYQQGAHTYLRFAGSYELNPLFERDVDRHRWVSRRFLAMLGATCVTIWFAWRGIQIKLFPPVAFTFWMGVLLLTEIPVLIRHARNLFTFTMLVQPSDVSGHISYPRWFSLQLSAVDFGLFALLFVCISTVDNPGFFLGGTLGCGLLALQDMQLAQRAKTVTPPNIERET